MQPNRSLPPPFAILRRGWPVAFAAIAAAPSLALAGPGGGSVVGGDSVATISTNGATTTIEQAASRAIINWQDFSVGENEHVVFHQPSASAAVLNRVIGNNASEILGNISANGRVFLINPNGIMFGTNAQVDVGALVATTQSISDNDFLGDHLSFSSRTANPVQNAGHIRAADGGFVVLSAAQIRNSGLIEARLGTVALASGGGFTLSFGDNADLIDFSVDSLALSTSAGIENLGEIVAAGGRILLSANVANELIQTVVNNQGRISATGISGDGGSIELIASGGNIETRNTLEASGVNGGTISLQSSNDILIGDTPDSEPVYALALDAEPAPQLADFSASAGETLAVAVDALTFKSIELYGAGAALGSAIRPLTLTATDGRIMVDTTYGDLRLGDVSAQANGSGDQDASIYLRSSYGQIQAGQITTHALSSAADSEGENPAANGSIEVNGHLVVIDGISSHAESDTPARMANADIVVTVDSQPVLCDGCSDTPGNPIPIDNIIGDGNGQFPMSSIGNIHAHASAANDADSVASANIMLDHATNLDESGQIRAFDAPVQLTGPIRSTASGGIIASDASLSGTFASDAFSADTQGTIDLGNASLMIGSGATELGADAILLDLLGASAHPELVPDSEAPNFAVSAPQVVLGNATIDGDHVFIQTDHLETTGSFSTTMQEPGALFVHLLPYTLKQDMGIDISRVTEAPERSSIGFDVLQSAFPGTTFVMGGTAYSGDVSPGLGGPLPENSENFVYYTAGDAGNIESLNTSGTVVVLNAEQPPPSSVVGDADAAALVAGSSSPDEVLAHPRTIVRNDDWNTQIEIRDTGDINVGPGCAVPQ